MQIFKLFGSLGKAPNVWSMRLLCASQSKLKCVGWRDDDNCKIIGEKGGEEPCGVTPAVRLQIYLTSPPSCQRIHCTSSDNRKDAESTTLQHECHSKALRTFQLIPHLLSVIEEGVSTTALKPVSSLGLPCCFVRKSWHGFGQSKGGCTMARSRSRSGHGSRRWTSLVTPTATKL